MLSFAIEQSQTFPIIIGSTSFQSRAFHTIRSVGVIVWNVYNTLSSLFIYALIISMECVYGIVIINFRGDLCYFVTNTILGGEKAFAIDCCTKRH